MVSDKKSKPALTRAFLSPTENMALGIFGGAFETSLQMPLLTWKFSVQQGRALPPFGAAWYRGVGAQVSAIAPITAVQVTTNGILQWLVAGGGKRDLEKWEQILTSMVAGASSAIIYTPADLVTIHQQRLKKGPMETIQWIHRKYGFKGLYRGNMSCALREAIYTCGYLGMTPVLKDYIQEAGYFTSDLGSGLSASLVAGIVSALMSHPVDTCKTVVQGDMDRSKYPNARTAASIINTEKGIPKGFYLGGLPRMLRNCGAFFVVGMLREAAIRYKTTSLGLDKKIVTEM